MADEIPTPNITVIGAGSWGTTAASLLAGNAPTTLWARRDELAEEIQERHTNQDYLPDAELNPELRATSSLEEAVGDADVVVMAVPAKGFREVLEQARPHIRPWIPVVSLTKGLESGSHLRMTEIIDELLPGHPAGVVTGPNIATEIHEGLAAAAVIAMPDQHVAAALQEVFRTTRFRLYTSTDVIGAEVAGALKNVVAIAAGMAEGLGAGDNTKAMAITRGLRELTRLGVAMGGEDHTFAGLAGMGDLITTCMSPRSRNRRVGEELGKGRSLQEIQDEMNMVAEGVNTTRVAMELSEEYEVSMPIASEMYGVLYEEIPPEQAFRGLLKSTPTTELEPG